MEWRDEGGPAAFLNWLGTEPGGKVGNGSGVQFGTARAEASVS